MNQMLKVFKSVWKVNKRLQKLELTLPYNRNFLTDVNSNKLSIKPNGISGITKINNYNLERISLKYTKSTKKQQTENEINESASSSEKDDELVEKDAKIVTAHLNSLRTDLVLKAGLNIARNKVEKAFYESRIRVNERKITKKSEQLHIGDEVDLIKGSSTSNPNFLNISRVVIVSTKQDDEDGDLIVQLKRYKSLLIENYDDSWKPVSS